MNSIPFKKRGIDGVEETIPDSTVREYNLAGIFLVVVGAMSAFLARYFERPGAFVVVAIVLLLVSFLFPIIQEKRWNGKMLDDQGKENYVRLLLVSLTLPLCFLLTVVLIGSRLLAKAGDLNLLTVSGVSGIAIAALALNAGGDWQPKIEASHSDRKWWTPEFVKGAHAWFITALSASATAVGVNSKTGLVPSDASDIFGFMAFSIGVVTLYLARTYRGAELFSRATQEDGVNPFGWRRRLAFGLVAFTIVFGPFALSAITSWLGSSGNPLVIGGMVMLIFGITAAQAWAVSKTGSVIAGKPDMSSVKLHGKLGVRKML